MARGDDQGGLPERITKKDVQKGLAIKAAREERINPFRVRGYFKFSMEIRFFRFFHPGGVRGAEPPRQGTRCWSRHIQIDARSDLECKNSPGRVFFNF